MKMVKLLLVAMMTFALVFAVAADLVDRQRQAVEESSTASSAGENEGTTPASAGGDVEAEGVAEPTSTASSEQAAEESSTASSSDQGGDAAAAEQEETSTQSSAAESSNNSEQEEATSTEAPAETSTAAAPAATTNFKLNRVVYLRGTVPKTDKHTYAFCASYVLNSRWLAALGDCFFVKADKTDNTKNLKDKSRWQLRSGHMFDRTPLNYSCSSGSSSSYSFSQGPEGTKVGGSRRLQFAKGNSQSDPASDYLKNFRKNRFPGFASGAASRFRGAADRLRRFRGAGLGFGGVGLYQPIRAPIYQPASFGHFGGFVGKRSGAGASANADDNMDSGNDDDGFLKMDKRFFSMGFQPDNIWSCTIKSKPSDKNNGLIDKIIIKPGYTKGAFGSNLGLIKLNADLQQDLIKTDDVNKPNSKLGREIKQYKTWIASTIASQ